MVNEVVLDQSVNQATEDINQDDYMKLCAILIGAIPLDRKQSWAGKVLTYLASQTMQSIEEGKGVPRISTKATQMTGLPNTCAASAGLWRTAACLRISLDYQRGLLSYGRRW